MSFRIKKFICKWIIYNYKKKTKKTDTNQQQNKKTTNKNKLKNSVWNSARPDQ